MPPVATSLFQPRKSPVQARSAASVGAILEATLQVLVVTGKERLTTTRVAERAGVSVGTLYQYFPNKSSLLQAVLRRHFENVVAAVEAVCAEQGGQPLAAMIPPLVKAFLRAKLRDGKGGVALYEVSSAVDGMRLVREISGRMHERICSMLRSAADADREMDVPLVTTVLRGAMAGVSRQLLESDDPERMLAPFEEQLTAMLRAYVDGFATPKAAI